MDSNQLGKMVVTKYKTHEQNWPDDYVAEAEMIKYLGIIPFEHKLVHPKY